MHVDGFGLERYVNPQAIVHHRGKLGIEAARFGARRAQNEAAVDVCEYEVPRVARGRFNELDENAIGIDGENEPTEGALNRFRADA
jgi:hypothetical protein